MLPHGIAVGDYPLDSHATQVPKPDQPHLIEGFFYGGPTQPYQIPMGIMLPRGLEGLLVPVAVSATHIGFSTIRMEPTWMVLGYAAGTAAYVSIRHYLPIREVPPALVQDVTLLSHQVTLYLKDVPYPHRDFAGLNYGGLIGLFPTYEAKPDETLDRGTAAQWLWQWCAFAGRGWKCAQGAHFSDLDADSPVAPAARVLAAAGAMGTVASGEPFRPAEALTAADAIQWIARAYGTSDPTGRSPRVKAELEQNVRALLEGAVQRASDIEAEKVTRGQFLRLLYLAAQVAFPPRPRGKSRASSRIDAISSHRIRVYLPAYTGGPGGNCRGGMHPVAAFCPGALHAWRRRTMRVSDKRAVDVEDHGNIGESKHPTTIGVGHIGRRDEFAVGGGTRTIGSMKVSQIAAGSRPTHDQPPGSEPR